MACSRECVPSTRSTLSYIMPLKFTLCTKWKAELEDSSPLSTLVSGLMVCTVGLVVVLEIGLNWEFVKIMFMLSFLSRAQRLPWTNSLLWVIGAMHEWSQVEEDSMVFGLFDSALLSLRLDFSTESLLGIELTKIALFWLVLVLDLTVNSMDYSEWVNF